MLSTLTVNKCQLIFYYDSFILTALSDFTFVVFFLFYFILCCHSLSLSFFLARCDQIRGKLHCSIAMNGLYCWYLIPRFFFYAPVCSIFHFIHLTKIFYFILFYIVFMFDFPFTIHWWRRCRPKKKPMTKVVSTRKVCLSCMSF